MKSPTGVYFDEGEAKAKQTLDFLRSIVVYPNIEDVEESMKFRLKH